jgi:uncharacterized membrane protein YphA (DoxX/SURF4 family)
MSRAGLLALFARFALASAFLSSVADRFGVWGAHGDPQVSWGDFEHFLAYSREVNALMPELLQRPLAWAATVAELALGVLLVLGLWLRGTSIASGALLVLFALSMSVSTGIKSALAYSVFTAAASAFLLASSGARAYSLDAWFANSNKARHKTFVQGSGGNAEEITS